MNSPRPTDPSAATPESSNPSTPNAPGGALSGSNEVSPEHDYLLGHHAEEWERLDAQHEVWRSAVLDDLQRVGLRPGIRVLDAGCGPGSLLADLAEIVGPTGRVVGLERDRDAAAEARRRMAGLGHVEVIEGDLLTTTIAESFDLVVCRWVMSFIEDVDAAVATLANRVVSGGSLFIQDYDHDGMRLWPGHPSALDAIEGFRALYRARGGNLWVGLDLPAAMDRAGLDPGPLMPRILAGRPGEPSWTWIVRFLREHIQDVVDGGELSAERAREFLDVLEEREQSPHSLFVSPVVIGVSGRRP